MYTLSAIVGRGCLPVHGNLLVINNNGFTHLLIYYNYYAIIEIYGIFRPTLPAMTVYSLDTGTIKGPPI